MMPALSDLPLSTDRETARQSRNEAEGGVMAKIASRSLPISVHPLVSLLNARCATRTRTMLARMLEAAEAAPASAYAIALTRWMRKGGTVALRDELCAPFLNTFRDKDDHTKVDKLAWWNAFADLDSAGLHARALVDVSGDAPALVGEGRL